MKICPECSAQYEDSIDFCAKDGRSLAHKIAGDTRLCPHCANSIPEDAATCPYCKAQVSAVADAQWPTREDDQTRVRLSTENRKFPAPAKIALLAGLALSLIGLALTGRAMLGQEDRSETRQLAEAKIKELQEKEQEIQSLEGQLTKARQEVAEKSNQLRALQGKLEESQKELTTTRQRLSVVSRAVGRLSSKGVQSSPTPSSLPANTAPSPARLPARRAAAPGEYEVIRPTEVHEKPVTSSRVLSRISKGTKVTVVRSVGEWLEVRSKYDNPPGFILRDDAMFVSKAN